MTDDEKAVERPDPLQTMGQSHAIRLGDDYDKSTDTKRKSKINEHIRQNDVFQTNIFQAYDDMTKGMSPQAIAFLYCKAYQMLGLVSQNLQIEGEEEEAQKFEQIRADMDELVDPNDLMMPAYDSNEKLQHPTHDLETIIEKHGKQMEQYALWVFSGTQVTSEGTGGGGGGGNDDL